MTSEVSPALLVDLYELTMADAYRQEGIADRRATFSLFVRSLPPEWGYLVAAGLEDCLSWLQGLHFTPSDLAAIDQFKIFPPDFLDWLAKLRFTGSVRAVPEGSIVFAGEPLLEVEGPIAEAQLAETYLLNQMTLQTTLATEAARCRHAAQGRAVMDFALRRVPGTDAGMKLARCCRLVGLGGTSNVAGAVRYGLAPSGTMAHSFVQAHADEMDAFRAYAQVFKEATVLLVDTYDTPRGIERAIQVAGEMRAKGIELHGVRLDSGDLGPLAALARRRLDEAEFPAMTVFVSGGLDEYKIDDLVERQKAPIDGFGVGTSLGAAGGAPTLDSVYKLVNFDDRPVRKTSTGKATWPGAKQVWRRTDWTGDLMALAGETSPDDSYTALLEPVMHSGLPTSRGKRDLVEANTLFERQWLALPGPLKRLRTPALHSVEPSAALRRLTAAMDAGRPGAVEADPKSRPPS
ncbi:MAG TPA: nicotinate phosphoribosyltransferase [Candidatus Nanopelagicaceae bacterium]|nr:nicotinate phosphoribosyltransferase [Candidatus Nanopelagicaceae bacterium]